MGPKPQTPQSGDLFRFPLAEHLNPKHELVLLGDAMNWSEIERTVSAPFASTTGRPALLPSLVVGLLYLQHAYCIFQPIVDGHFRGT
jgi:IS5 family transposase